MAADHTTRHDRQDARLARIEGQVRGIRRMIQEGAYCIDIIHQIEAVRAALKSVSGAIMTKHLEHCVTDAMKNRDEAEVEQKIAEIMQVMKVKDK